MWLPRLWSSRRERMGNGSTMASGSPKDHAGQRMVPQEQDLARHFHLARPQTHRPILLESPSSASDAAA